MGEVLAAKTLIDLMKKELRNDKASFSFVISTTTETGQERAKTLFPEALGVFYWPFDFRFSVKRVFKKIKPDLLILTEGDFWYGALWEAKKRNVPVCVINGKISEKSCDRFSIFKKFSKKLFGLINLFCVQSPLFAARFEKMGVPSHKIISTGNIKADIEPRRLTLGELDQLRSRLGISSSDFVVVAGSTHSPEEELIVNSLPEDSKLILVPRHPERFSSVYSLLAQKGIPTIRLSQISDASSLKHHRVLLVDTMGMLITCYQIADVAIVAGSFVEKVGGHNIVEPAQYGIPTIVGPYMFSQSALFESAMDMDAVLQVATSSELREVLTHLKNDSVYRAQAGKRAFEFVESMRGATQRTLNSLKDSGVI